MNLIKTLRAKLLKRGRSRCAHINNSCELINSKKQRKMKPH
jgi:hypothetical protein